MSRPDYMLARELLGLPEGAELFETDGAVWLRVGGEFKYSPWGSTGDFDRECSWFDREYVREVAERWPG